MIGATGTYAGGTPSIFLPSDVLRKLCAKPIQQVRQVRQRDCALELRLRVPQSNVGVDMAG
jgi:hypothetical protein